MKNAVFHFHAEYVNKLRYTCSSRECNSFSADRRASKRTCLFPLFRSYIVTDVLDSSCLFFIVILSIFAQSKEKELMEFSKAVNEARSKMDVAQSELDIYLSRHNTAVSQLNQAKEALTTTSEILKERKAAIKDIDIKLPRAEKELKEVRLNFHT